ncbi:MULTISPECIES: UvrD-helicase domain-containing protein [Acinetobacter]|uniref:UvrD-helicase domain-containing protein n=1 Tax=Acinetobacter TaxID=469 RepID=UPI0002AEC3E0|nr:MULTISPECIES: UvrD-helicase domain-containing protein [Acinetobacter]ELW83798.1 UvrD/REP helicase N-terminal domain protein [Acinetobacter sp. WC-743]MBJ8425657.1 ATP-dependent helicase [Acinetobacter bereziniae]MBJ8476956.1 ATP-dependent helicase [Acinetobacter bereziniae]
MQTVDTVVLEDLIFDYISSSPPQSFVLYAGAGAGKTHTLHQTLKKIKENILLSLSRENKKLAVITYTNAACDEIKERINFDSNFFVSTIHSFAWSLISPFTKEIKQIIRENLQDTISDEEEALSKSKNLQNKTSLGRQERIAKSLKRLSTLDSTKRFSYNPNSSNVEESSLEHSEVIDIFSRLLIEKKSFKRILVNKYPILFLDEAQDTYEKVIDALVQTQVEFHNQFVMGLFGDNMQRIFTNNKKDLDTFAPEDWRRPQKVENWRCPKRVVTLINKVRFDADKFQQESKVNHDGFVRCLIVDTNKPNLNKLLVEDEICKTMREITNDDKWNIRSEIKTLILEHHMAATRSGFHVFYKSLYDDSALRNKLSTADTQSLRFLVGIFCEFINSIMSKNDFGIIKVLRTSSDIFRNFSIIENQLDYLKSIRDKKNKLFNLLMDGNNSIKIILTYIYEHNLLNIPPLLLQALILDIHGLDEDEISSELLAYSQALDAPIDQLFKYASYIDGSSAFDTHQGVKGLQFERVMAILDDDEAGGFLFDYEKFLGIKDLSVTDIKNESLGLDSALSRTRRLFYVICSRSEKSLAVVCYTKNPNLLKEKLIQKEWFEQEEIILL